MKNENENNQFNESSDNFGLPQGYFQYSAGSIMNKIEWQDEHKGFPRLSELKNENGFLIPENYFSHKERKLELINYPTLQEIKNINIFSLPLNYFDELEIRELAKVIGEAENDTRILKAFKKENKFELPENYFEETEKVISDKISSQKQAKVVSLFTKRIRFAAAAAFVIVMGLWLYNLYSPTVSAVDCGTIACLDKQDIVKSKSIESLDDEQLYDLVDPSALEKKLDPKNNERNTKTKDSSLNTFSEEDLLDGDI